VCSGCAGDVAVQSEGSGKEVVTPSRQCPIDFFPGLGRFGSCAPAATIQLGQAHIWHTELGRETSPPRVVEYLALINVKSTALMGLISGHNLTPLYEPSSTNCGTKGHATLDGNPGKS